MKKRAWHLLVFWGLAYLFFYWHFTEALFQSYLDLAYAGLFLLLLAPPVILINNFYIPKYLQRKTWYYSLGLLGFLIVLCFLGSTFNSFFFTHLVARLLPDVYLINYFTGWELYFYHLTFTLVAILLNLSRGWFESLELQKEIGRLKEMKLETELNAIKAQLNPHFLFNSLNSIYSLALKQNPRTSDAVVNLSDLLRYSLHKTNQREIPLSEELEMVQKYLDLQQLRFQVRPDVVISRSEMSIDLNIPPFLLIPLFENAFKHGDPEGDSFIRAHIKSDPEDFEFTMSNAQKMNVKKENDHNEKGLGLHSIRKQLGLYYGENQKLTVTNGKRFEVNIRIKMMKNEMSGN